MKTTLLLLFFFIQLSLFSQTSYPHWEWARSYGGVGNDITSDIKLKNGYIYITGTFSSPTMQWDKTILTNNGGQDIFVAKLDSNGNTIWVKNFGGISDDSVTQLEINRNNVFVLLCNSKSNDITIGTEKLDTPKNFIAKFDSDGDLLMAKPLPDSISYKDIDIDNEGGIYVACTYSYRSFQFAGKMVSLIQPPTPPKGSGVVYPNGDSSNYCFSCCAPDYSSGAAVLKYNENGSEAWIKVFHATPNGLLIDFDSHDNLLVTLFQRFSSLDFDHTFYRFIPGPPEAFFAKTLKVALSPNADVYNFDDNLGVSSQLTGMEICDNGSGAYSEYGSSPKIYLYTNLIGIESGQITNKSVSNLPYDLNYLTAADNGRLLINKNPILILGSDLKADADTVYILNSSGLSLNARCMENRSIYFGDSFSADSLIIGSDSISPALFYNLQNNGGKDIFIGKYHRIGYKPNLPLSFNTFKDTIKVCDGLPSLYLDKYSVLKNQGSGNLSYQWEPAENFADPEILNSSIIMKQDSLVSTLTIKDEEGKSISKKIVFLRGVKSDLYLTCSYDSTLCDNNFAVFTLHGTIYTPCYLGLHPWAPENQDYSWILGVNFDSLNQSKTVNLSNYKNYNLSNHFYLNYRASNYCTYPDTTPVIINQIFSENTYKKIFLCPGESYTIAGDTTYTNISKDFSIVKNLKTQHGCDSTVVNDIRINITPQHRQEKITTCVSDYTFPDGTTIKNIQKDTTHESILFGAGGCDSIHINTYFSKAITSYRSDDILLCEGSNYTFPDGMTINNISSDINHVNQLSGMGCEGNIYSFIRVISSVHRTENITICPENNGTYTFPDNTIFTNINSDSSHTSHLYTSNGCDSFITTHLIFVNPPPVKNIYDSAEVCTGSNYTFPDNTTQLISANTIHKSHFHSSCGCDSVIITTYIEASPEIDTSITKTGVQLMANANNVGYQWQDCNSNTPIASETNQNFTPSTEGNYNVIITQKGCVDTSSCYTITAGELYGQRPLLTVYPVPVSNQLTITVQSDVITSLGLSLYNFSGESVLSEITQLTVGKNTININVQLLKAGMYTLRLFNYATQKAIIKKIIIN